MRPLVYEAMEKIGVQMHTTKSDTLKDSGSMFRPPTPEEEKKEQELVDDLYQQFLEAVAEGRKMTMDQVKTLATGEVFTGRRAKELGLIDETGDLERAIDIASELSGAPRKPVWVHPKRGLRDVIQGLTGRRHGGRIRRAARRAPAAEVLLPAPPLGTRVPTAHVLRVFTDESGAFGNHLGIVIEDEAPLMRERRQAIAAELGYSETVFFQDVDTAALRIFTPAC
jgi:ClpP class serine protease